MGKQKDSELVRRVFAKVTGNIDEIQIFHTDKGNEFKNQIIEEILEGFEIQRYLSRKGCPYDNAVAEVTYKIIKTEFVDSNIWQLG